MLLFLCIHIRKNPVLYKYIWMLTFFLCSSSFFLLSSSMRCCSIICFCLSFSSSVALTIMPSNCSSVTCGLFSQSYKQVTMKIKYTKASIFSFVVGFSILSSCMEREIQDWEVILYTALIWSAKYCALKPCSRVFVLH